MGEDEATVIDEVGEDGEWWVLLKRERDRRVGFIENTARRHRRGGRSGVTVTS